MAKGFRSSFSSVEQNKKINRILRAFRAGKTSPQSAIRRISKLCDGILNSFLVQHNGSEYVELPNSDEIRSAFHDVIVKSVVDNSDYQCYQLGSRAKFTTFVWQGMKNQMTSINRSNAKLAPQPGDGEKAYDPPQFEGIPPVDALLANARFELADTIRDVESKHPEAFKIACIMGQKFMPIEIAKATGKLFVRSFSPHDEPVYPNQEEATALAGYSFSQQYASRLIRELKDYLGYIKPRKAKKNIYGAGYWAKFAKGYRD